VSSVCSLTKAAFAISGGAVGITIESSYLTDEELAERAARLPGRPDRVDELFHDRIAGIDISDDLSHLAFVECILFGRREPQSGSVYHSLIFDQIAPDKGVLDTPLPT